MCPHCGEMIASTARACPHCGSDERTGWSQQTYLDGIDLPDDSEYDEMVANEFGTGQDGARAVWWKSWRAAVAAALLLLAAVACLRSIL